MGGTHRQVGHVVERLHPVAGARPYDVNLDPELVKPLQFRVLHQAAHNAQRGTRRIQVRRRRGKHPFLQPLEQLVILLCLLHLREARKVGVRHQLVRDGAARLHEYQREVLEPRVPLCLRHAGPPVVLAEVLAGKVQLVEIILQQQPRSLRVVAGGKNLEQLGALGHVLLRLGQLMAQIGEVTVGAVDHLVVRVVLGRFRGTDNRLFFLRFPGHC